MAGRIREQSIQEVREKARIDDVVGQYVTLRNAGGGSYKGLCPFHDEKSPSFNVNPSRGFYHCLAAETRVLTWEGPREIKDLAGGVHRILNRHGDWVEAPFRSYGIQRLYKITVSRNRQRKELFATDGHRWFIRAGRTGGAEREKQTLELRAGDRLVPRFPRSRIQRPTPSPFGIAHGFTFGDGTRSGSGSLAKLCPPKDLAMLKWFPNSHTTSAGENLLVHHLPAFFKALPPIDESGSYLYGWLAGYFAADGCVAEDGTVVLSSAARENLEFVRTVCTRLGIATYDLTSQVRLGLGTEPTDRYRVHLVNEDLTPDFFLIDEHRRRFESNTKQFARRGWVVQGVEETDRVEEVYCAEVEDGHAFTLEDNILTGNCFGCGEGGDVISFMMKIDGLSFGETVERLADKYGVTLQREDGDGPIPERRGPARGKLIEAHKVAAEFFAEQLLTPGALPGRQFLAERSFDQEAAQRFGVGFAPTDGKMLHQHLRGRGFTEEELVVGGLVRQSGWSVFQGRLIWPIRESSGDVIGFGARKLFDDDRIAGKYINTSETPIYKKNQVLYGIDLAREGMRKTGRAVVVEGYTDVMACHLAGVTTAVATCGTAFTPEHGKVVRRFMADFNASAGEVVFTFDGDAAGQAAAMKVFAGDEGFASQTYVAVAPDGLDPCDLRLKHGDDAVRELVAGRQPLYRFVLGNVVAKYDLDRADGRVDALREGARLVSSVRDRSKVDAFARELAQMVGVDPQQALAEVRRSVGRRPAPPVTGATPPQRPAGPDPRDPRFALERETLKVLVQHPMAVGRLTAEVTTADFVHPAYQAVWALILAAGGPGAGTGDPGWATRLAAAAPTPAVAGIISALAVEPLPSRRTPDAGYVTEHVVRLLEASLQRQIADAHSRLQRADPAADPDGYRALFEELAGLEQQRRALRDRVLGG